MVHLINVTMVIIAWESINIVRVAMTVISHDVRVAMTVISHD